MIYEFEPKQFIYNRTGILATTTAVNEEIAAQFMRLSDLRRNIVIVDSGKEPESNTVTVSSDTLAWRAVAPLSELTKTVLRPKQFHQIEIVDQQYVVQIHEQIIDDNIRKKSYFDHEDYERKYLTRLKKEVKDASAEILWNEKIGFSQQTRNWLLYSLPLAVIVTDLIRRDYPGALIQAGILIGFTNPMLNVMENDYFNRTMQYLNQRRPFSVPGFQVFIPPYRNPRSWKKAFYPLFPIDKWVQGRIFLAKHGQELITAKT